ncbi:short-chain dehydrogenase reductase 3b [Selaginella moellendorffii]|nr:short-chain dehydrogenase reductase 3b [Selaginella moellendorffii]|eukprot:XP_002971756.2 short-chain dehydrogenase reductase 3b [Selaginella moellendorffii]
MILSGRRLLRQQSKRGGRFFFSTKINHDQQQHTRQELLRDKVAVITGGANGIGAATARLFASNGARLVIADIDDESGARLEAEVGGPAVCRYVHCDVGSEADIVRAVRTAVSEFGRLDVMHNNAGVLNGRHPSPSISSMEAAELDFLYAVNVRGAALGIKHASRVMIEQHVQGSILCTASVSAMVAGLALHPYTITKHAILGLVKTCALELAHYGIRVNCITPNGVLTDLLCSVGRHLRHLEIRDGKSCPGAENCEDLRTMLAPEDVAKAALFLASDDSKYISGHSLVIDGSFSAGAAGGLNVFKGLQRGEIEFVP